MQKLQMSENPILVTRFRGDYPESVHRGAVCVVDRDNNILFSLGNVMQKPHSRSALKLVQQLPLLESGAVGLLNLTLSEIAVMCGSHNGEKDHIGAVRSCLAKAGLDEKHLKCGSQYPWLYEDRKEFYKNGTKPGDIYNNCSGKHAGFLIGSKIGGFDLDSYLDFHHPWQELVREAAADLLEYPSAELKPCTDGCSAPTYPVPVYNQAIGVKNLSCRERFSKKRQEAIDLLAKALVENPFMIAGTGRYCTDMMRQYHGRVIGKVGAEGIFTMVFLKEKIGCAIKIDDGKNGPQFRVAEQIIRKIFGLDARDSCALDKYISEPLKNRSGIECGREEINKELFENLKVE